MKIPFLPLSLCAVALAFPADKHIAARQVTADNIVNGIERNGNILSQLAAVQTNADKVTGTLFIAGRLKVDHTVNSCIERPLIHTGSQRWPQSRRTINQCPRSGLACGIFLRQGRGESPRQPQEAGRSQ